MSKYEGSVQELDPHGLVQIEKQSRQSKTTYVILFYASWCGHCEELMPVFSEAAKALPGRYPNVAFGRIDASKYKQELVHHNIKGYPTLMTLVDGNYNKFSGKRTFENINDFVGKTRRKE
ncbi:Protein disulfide-isomerase 2 [Echinococcus granulosus]|uniref:Thioredoxin fold n=1 Tax=Echinococcus granulosus TaxID=6210 RepID=A0A068WX37_ECHGR|nr:Protein disulfide-isomerase 2 [Echinococcus granulosus]CDS24375.1 Thioredoxin fold [Echinococcus granulosus]